MKKYEGAMKKIWRNMKKIWRMYGAIWMNYEGNNYEEIWRKYEGNMRIRTLTIYMGRGTWKHFELIVRSREGGVGWFAISRFRGTPEKRHETCQLCPYWLRGDSNILGWKKEKDHFYIHEVTNLGPSQIISHSNTVSILTRTYHL